MSFSKLLLPLLPALGALGAHIFPGRTFRRRIETLVVKLRLPVAVPALAEPMPAIVRSFARRGFHEGSAATMIRLQQRAEMRFKPGGAWYALTAEQTIGIREPGFVWLATARMFPSVWVRVLDAYVAGTGLLEVRLFGSWKLSEVAGPLASKGELMRYLAELPWAPQAILCNPHLRWRQLDENLVEVSAESQAGRAQVRFAFENGDIVRAEADGRPRMEGKRIIPTPWRGNFFDYRELNGLRIPARAEASWLLDGRPFVYWRGELTNIAAE